MAKKKTDTRTNRQLRTESAKTPRTPEQQRVALRRLVRMFYDMQRLRMQSAGRGGKKLDGDKKAPLTDNIELTEIDRIQLERRASELLAVEKEALKDVEAHLKTMPAYTKILADKTRFKGIGPTMAGVILSEVDIHRAHTASALWRYAGLAPVACRRCTNCKDEVVKKNGGYEHKFARKAKCLLASKAIPESKTFESGRAERAEKGTKLPFNRFFKTKMVGVMSGCLIKCGSPYRKFYDDYKHRLASSNRGRDDGHRHQMALRYMVKMVLLDIWRDWRALEGLEVREPYQAEYLGHRHHTS